MAASVQASQGAAGRRLRVASLNVWGLAWPLSRDLPRRIAGIGRALAGLDADLVAFQEVWTDEGARALVASGRAAGLEPARTEPPVGGGLLVLSRWPVERARFEPFVTRGLPERIWHGDYWGGKGFALVRVRTPAGPIEFVNTHLHAQYDEAGFPEYRAHRIGQAIQLAAEVAALEMPVVAAGDFNARPDSADYAALADLGGLRDAAREAGRPQPTSLASNPYNPASERDARIDYVFVRDGRRRSLHVDRIARTFDAPLEIDGRRAALSDHAGLFAELDVTPSAARAHRPTPAAIEAARAAVQRGVELAERRRSSRRASAVASAGLGAGALAARSRISRRTLLRGALAAAAGVAAGSALTSSALSEIAIRHEIRDFQRIDALLDRLSAASAGGPESAGSSRR